HRPGAPAHPQGQYRPDGDVAPASDAARPPRGTDVQHASVNRAARPPPRRAGGCPDPVSGPAWAAGRGGATLDREDATAVAAPGAGPDRRPRRRAMLRATRSRLATACGGSVGAMGADAHPLADDVLGTLAMQTYVRTHAELRAAGVPG